MTQVVINTGFIYKLRPERIIIIAISILCITLIVAPIKVNNTLTISSFLYIALSILTFLIGTK